MPSSYYSIKQISEIWGISARRIQMLCSDGRIEGAIRIGNTWAIPSNSKKPVDRRIKKGNGSLSCKSFKSIVKKFISLLYLNNKVDSDVLKIHQTMLYYSAFLLTIFNKEPVKIQNSQELEFVENLFNQKFSSYIKIDENIDDYFVIEYYDIFKHNKKELMYSLSWAYQCIKDGIKNDLTSTQFFTEKYMISTLVDCYQFKDEDVILDPSCGTGNFLAHIFYKKFNETFDKNSLSIEKINHILNTIIGYDLDPFLAFLTSINLIITSAFIFDVHCECLSINQLKMIKTRIYTTKESMCIGGFLDVGSDVVIKNITDGSECQISELISNTTYLFTNPPFKTIKGMNIDLKLYLKNKLPLCKCDLCVSFLITIIKCVKKGCIVGLVVQNSWIFLKSFDKVRQFIDNNIFIDRLIILGAGAFTDISGEKTAVSLINYRKINNSNDQMMYANLSDLSYEQKKDCLEKQSLIQIVPQSKFLKLGSLTYIDNSFLNYIFGIYQPYSNFAIPMQGTSTGDSKKLIDYYWNHIGDSDWIPVSKGGSYSRWYGLNNYCVHWGHDGKYIRETKGSALRNISHFKDTQIVFSDTGTSGLNVRKIMEGQIFVASGPGIRLIKGDVYAHLAFLNSEYASYCIKYLTPKLTISAGYIGKIPVNPDILLSDEISNLAKKCVNFKKSILSRRPVNYEHYSFQKIPLDELINDTILKDFTDEIRKMSCEREINDIVYFKMGLKEDDVTTIQTEFETNYNFFDKQLSIPSIDTIIDSIIDCNCSLKKVRVSKKSLGCDGPLEYASRISESKPEYIYNQIVQNMSVLIKIRSRYRDMILHSCILNALGFRIKKMNGSCKLEDVIHQLNYLKYNYLELWINKNFNKVHNDSFVNSPVYYYNSEKKIFESIK